MKLRFGWKLNSYASFNVTRARPKKRDLSAGTLDLIREKNCFDIELYDRAKVIFEETVGAAELEVKRIASELEDARARSQGSLGSTLFSFRAATRKAINRVYSAI